MLSSTVRGHAEHGRVGGVGRAVAQELRDARVTTPVYNIGLPQRFDLAYRFPGSLDETRSWAFGTPGPA